MVTGGSGFVGTHLTEELVKVGYQVANFDIKNSLTSQDFRDYNHVRTFIDHYRPEYIFHIGAIAFVPESNADPYLTFETNTIGSLNILEAVRKLGLETKIQLCGSSEEYGDTMGPITEDSTMYPLSPYAIAKMAMDHLGQYYSNAFNMNVVVTRTFNHTGPGRGEQYAEGSFAKQIAEIEAGKRTTLEHGDLKPTRNYTDVRDVVKAYVKAINLNFGVYNICSDTNITMREVLNILCDMSEKDIICIQDPQRLRLNDFSFAEPSSAAFRLLTNWEPTIDLKTTLQDILNYWRARV